MCIRDRILTFSFGFIYGKKAGLLYGLFAGILLDLFYSGPFGFYTLLFINIGYFNGICTQYYYEDYINLPLVMSLVNELIYNLYIYCLLYTSVDSDLTARTREIAEGNAPAGHKPVPKPDDVEMSQLTLFDTVREDDIIEELKNLELGNMTPIDALNTLYRMQTKLKNRWSGNEK